MGKPAARAGDVTSHGAPLNAALGSKNVLIGGKRAWRAYVDIHICPIPGPPPHVGGTAALGSTKVFINGLPAIRQGDQIIEFGPPNIILTGCPKVLIGD